MNNPHSFLEAVTWDDLGPELDTNIARVSIEPLLFSSGGVRPADDSGQQRLIVVLAEDHGSQYELLGSFAHEVLHVALAVRFSLTDRCSQEPHHTALGIAAGRLVRYEGDKIWNRLIRFVPADDLRKTFLR